MIQIKSFTFNPFSENMYLVFDENKETIVFDPGCYTTNEKKILKKFIEDNNLIIKRLINTHCHLDHIFGNIFVMENYNVEVECHVKELPVLARASVAGDLYGVPTPPQPTPSAFIEDDAIIEVGEMSFRAIFAPGHSPGSLCFYNEKEQFLIGGDVLFHGSIGRTDLPGGSHNQLLESIEKRLMVLPENVKVYSGHGVVTTIGFEKYNNPFLTH